MKKITLIILLLFGFACNQSTSEKEILNVLIAKAEGDKLHNMMTLWFDEFMRNQEKGDILDDANLSAIKVVIQYVEKESVMGNVISETY
jgi:hypothetical protein